MKHKFMPLKSQLDGSAAGTIFVRCLETGAITQWNKAAESGWVADLNGKPFSAYYSKEGAARLIARSEQAEIKP